MNTQKITPSSADFIRATSGVSELVAQAIANRPTNTILHSEISQEIKIPTVFPKIDIALPKTFDGRKVWAGLLTPSVNQGKCGSCWAFASSNCLADKFNIQSMGQMHVELSPVRMIICDYATDPDYTSLLSTTRREIMTQSNVKALQESACFGNTLINAWNFLYIWGTNTRACAPYQEIADFVGIANLPLCTAIFGINADMCADSTFREKIAQETGTPAKFFRCRHFYLIPNSTESMKNQDYIKYSIYKYGPVTSSFEIFPNFYTFDPKKEIYIWDGQGQMISGHAISIVGWGERETENGTVPYWIIKNFWGPEWGMDGYFYMIRGINNCKIEDNVVDAAPDFFYPPNYEPPYLHQAEISEGSTTAMRRFLVENEINLLNGGLDPTTGYSRRLLRSTPWLDKSRPVQLNKLPNFSKWVAGRDATIENRIDYQRALKSNDKNESKNESNLLLITAIFVLLFFLILTIYFNRASLEKNILKKRK